MRDMGPSYLSLLKREKRRRALLSQRAKELDLDLADARFKHSFTVRALQSQVQDLKRWGEDYADLMEKPEGSMATRRNEFFRLKDEVRKQLRVLNDLKRDAIRRSDLLEAIHSLEKEVQATQKECEMTNKQTTSVNRMVEALKISAKDEEHAWGQFKEGLENLSRQASEHLDGIREVMHRNCTKEEAKVTLMRYKRAVQRLTMDQKLGLGGVDHKAEGEEEGGEMGGNELTELLHRAANQAKERFIRQNLEIMELREKCEVAEKCFEVLVNSHEDSLAQRKQAESDLSLAQLKEKQLKSQLKDMKKKLADPFQLHVEKSPRSKRKGSSSSRRRR